jgi:hypothetical protein
MAELRQHATRLRSRMHGLHPLHPHVRERQKACTHRVPRHLHLPLRQHPLLRLPVRLAQHHLHITAWPQHTASSPMQPPHAQCEADTPRLVQTGPCLNPVCVERATQSTPGSSGEGTGLVGVRTRSSSLPHAVVAPPATARPGSADYGPGRCGLVATCCTLRKKRALGLGRWLGRVWASDSAVPDASGCGRGPAQSIPLAAPRGTARCRRHREGCTASSGASRIACSHSAAAPIWSVSGLIRSREMAGATGRWQAPSRLRARVGEAE